jgi:hypothetical protein
VQLGAHQGPPAHDDHEHKHAQVHKHHDDRRGAVDDHGT